MEVILGGCNLGERMCVYVLCVCDQAPLSRAVAGAGAGGLGVLRESLSKGV